METFETIRQRHSTREFDGRAIERSSLERVIDAARLAPTARNAQPWAFIVVTERHALVDLAAMTDHGKFIAQAGACVAIFCSQGDYALEDGCSAATQLILAATDLGIQSCWVAGAGKQYGPRCREFLGLPPDFMLVAFVALGYEPAPRERAAKRALGEVLHWEKW